jgi:F-type H+-transporting ATPase subunit gamma
MPSLKDLKNRIKSVKSTQKITKAMKMVAAAKLRRAREQAEAARPYAESMEGLLANLAAGSSQNSSERSLLSGTGKSDTHLIVVATSDRGLCGGFNSTIVRAVKRKTRELQASGVTVKLLFVGRKGYEQLYHDFSKIIVGKNDLPKKKISYSDAENISRELITRFEAGEFDVAHVVYNKFKSAISQVVTFQQLIPLEITSNQQLATNTAPYEYEPNEAEILADLLPKNLSVQVYRSLLENAASEQGARMTAMDNATRNAGEMIKKLSLKYNRTRQAAITKELIEIISGAEAV